MASTTAVIGLGRSGMGAARLLKALHHDVCVFESEQTPQLEQRAAILRREGIDVELGQPLQFQLFQRLRPDAVVLSPGVRWDHPVLIDLRAQDLPVFNEMELAWHSLKDHPWIGITGTNGKTTITTLLGHLLRQSGCDAPTCGNIGTLATDLAMECRKGRRPDWLVVEVSSFQIEASPSLAPRIGIWSNLTPDHLDRHGSLAAYGAIKASLISRSDIQVLNADDPELRTRRSHWPQAQWVTCGPAANLEPGISAALAVEDGMVASPQGPLFPVDTLPLPGKHNVSNMLLATAAALKVGLLPEQIAAGLRCFPGVPHRLERLGTCQGITYFNDSKATNFEAACTALDTLDGPLLLLAGGRAKQGCDPDRWFHRIADKAAAVLLYGEAAAAFAQQLQHACPAVPRLQEPGLAEAVPRAHALALEQGVTTVLLSPACASFDQYPGFEARGDHFRSLVQQLPSGSR